jgi:hypothetical protein
MPYKINASDVAAIIGKNKYKSIEEVFERIAIENGIIGFEESNLLNEVESELHSEIKDVLSGSNAAEIEESMNVYERKTEKLIVNDIILRTLGEAPIFSKQVDTPSDVQDEFRSICAKSANSSDAIEAAISNPIVTKFLKESKEVVQSVKSINTLRGQKLEEKSTDAYQEKSGTDVKFRNSKCYIYTKGSWLIAGRVDGLTDDAVVETKTRRRFWKSPPEYDIIQLRCYMKLCNKKVGILNEQFPDNTSKVTRIEWSDTIWESIEESIDESIAEFENMYITK